MRWRRPGRRARAARPERLSAPAAPAALPASVEELLAAARTGSPRAVARLVSLVEDGSELLPALHRAFGRGIVAKRVWGITGAPGVGKSTTTSALVRALRTPGRDDRVGVLAVDPSSPFSGGALLGDRVRMQEHALDPSVYIRSMATRGHLGGLAAATPQAVRVLAAAGCDVVIVETVGVGQSEVEVVGLADTTVVLVAPGMGDGVQAAKAGILEVGDVFVVNKADREGAGAAAKELRSMLSLGPPRAPQDWRPRVVSTVASRGDGLPELLGALDDHAAWLERTGELHRRRVRRAAAEVQALALATVRERFTAPSYGPDLDSLAERVATGDLDPYTAAAELTAPAS